MKKIKKVFMILAAVSVALMLPVQAMAAVDLNAKYDISTNQIQGWPAGADIISDTGVLMDADTGVVLYNKGADEQRYPASITKIMTLLVAVENSSMDEQVTFTQTGVQNVNADSSNIGTQVGEVLSMKDCLYALIIKSANDVAAQIAEHIGGTEQAFIDMMNQRAQEIGCTNTHFATPNGLDAGYNHYTTASDLAKIAQYAIKKPMFRKLVSTGYYSFSNLTTGRSYSIGTTNALLGNVPGVQGMKTGYTNKAGYCFVGLSYSARGNTYISVVLGADSSSARWQDSRTLLTYAYNH